MTTIVNYNGSRFAGSSHASTKALIELLKVEPLDIELSQQISLTADGLTKLSGSFLRIAHAFSIHTDNKELLKQFFTAFEENYKLRCRDNLPEISERTLRLMRDSSIPSDMLGKDLESEAA